MKLLRPSKIDMEEVGGSILPEPIMPCIVQSGSLSPLQELRTAPNQSRCQQGCQICLAHQQSLLPQLKDTLIFDANNSTILVKWNQSSDCCSWAGISCEVGRVTGLDLSHEPITGGINDNSCLWNLIYLKTLDLPFIPSRANLSYLNLSSSFSGQIPKEISLLKKLRILDLSDSSNLRISNLRMLVQNLTELEELYLDYVYISAPGYEWGQALSSSLPNLRVLIMAHCGLGSPIHRSLAKLQHLSVIVLSYNKLSSPVPTLRIPNISDNGLLEGSLPEFPTNSDLQFLDIRFTNFSGPLPKSIATLTQLVHLDSSHNQFVGPISSAHLESLLNLVSINLSNNAFNGNILSSLFTLPLLEGIDLSNNQFSSQILEFPNAPSSMLESIDLSSNKLQSPISIFNQLHGKIPILSPYVYYVDLSSNSFTSSVPSEIGKNHRNTFYFSLSNNSLTGIIPDSICEAINLQLLDPSNNKLTGIIPTCMLAKSVTIEVNRHNNKLSGPILDLFPVGCGLRTLDLSGNFLTKSNPKSLANCRQLEDLDLGNNQMLDTFPIFLKNISSLRVLSLRSHKFYGQVTCTDSIGDWPMIEIVDIASNNFSGELPGKCLTKWHTMMTVGGRIDSSPLPGLIGTEHDYQVAAAIINKGVETKMIPSSFGNIRQIESLDLSRNHLNCTIPASLSNLNFLGFLNLSYNQLHGRIPTGNQIQIFSTDRFQGNQGLCGLPVTLNCPGDAAAPDISPETPKANRSISGNNDIEWNLISAEIGFIVGFGTVIGPLVFRKRWWKRYFDRVEDIAFSILPQKFLRNGCHGRWEQEEESVLVAKDQLRWMSGGD
ncbi:hypothetical protein FNV43_RR08497 [Rhamnella rubrinervis]|uniref:Leucine-rich repeat-containing N-terminal plant-type domain-containing protein n=1 Tax=Rhamnella rubrinervis TaxID=2594499 RepID=A0A8K0H9G2_9ROSA|nr:hypothetical protein FNV43_RR08497 [Rhamnella rubrinervis]